MIPFKSFERISIFVLFLGMTSLSCDNTKNIEKDANSKDVVVEENPNTKVLISAQEYQNWFGTFSYTIKGKYNKNYDDYEGMSGTLIIEQGSSHVEIKFQLSIAGIPECMGDIEGVVILDNPNSFVFKGNGEISECVLKFTNENESIRIEEIACDEWHGAKCSFSGTYFKE